MKIKHEFKLESRTSKLETSGPTERGLIDKLRFCTTLPVDRMEGLFSSKDAFTAAVLDMYNELGGLKAPELGKVEMFRKGTGLNIKLKSEFGDPLEFKENNELDGIEYLLKEGRVADLSLWILVRPDTEEDGALGALIGKSVTFSADMKDSVEVEEKEKQGQLQVSAEQDDGSAKAGAKSPRVKGARQVPRGTDGEKPTMQ